MKIQNVLLIDDNPHYCGALRLFFSREKFFRLVDSRPNGKEGLAYIQAYKPDICLVDIEMPEMDGLGLIRALKKGKSSPKILILSEHSDRKRLTELSQLGVDGFVLKSDESSEILQALEAISRGERYFSHKIGERLYDVLAETTVSRLSLDGPKELTSKKKISEREIQIAGLVAEGLSNKEIASRLECSENTVKTHKANIMRKIGAKNSVEISRWYLQLQPQNATS